MRGKNQRTKKKNLFKKVQRTIQDSKDWRGREIQNKIGGGESEKITEGLPAFHLSKVTVKLLIKSFLVVKISIFKDYVLPCILINYLL